MFFRIPRLTPGYIRYLQKTDIQTATAGVCRIRLPDSKFKLDKMEILARLFPYGKTIAGMRQTQAAQTVLQSRQGPVMPCMAILMGLTGIGMSFYSSRQLTLHCKPSSHLFR